MLLEKILEIDHKFILNFFQVVIFAQNLLKIKF